MYHMVTIYWTGLPCPPLGDLLNQGSNVGSPALQADSLPLSQQRSPANNIYFV